MSQSLADHYAHRFAAWLHKARTCHTMIRTLVTSADVIERPHDGTVLVRVSAAAWQAAETEAATPPPEPLSGGSTAANGSTNGRKRAATPRPRNTRGVTTPARARRGTSADQAN